MRTLPGWLFLCLLMVTNGCAFHSTATHWNGRVGANGKPVFVKATTNVGVNLLVVIPLFGNTTTDRMLEETTHEIAKEGSDRLRVIQTKSENYWHGFPPFTWILTPVITDVAIEYEPSEEELKQVEAQEKAAGEHPASSGDEDHSQASPDGQR